MPGKFVTVNQEAGYEHVSNGKSNGGQSGQLVA